MEAEPAVQGVWAREQAAPLVLAAAGRPSNYARTLFHMSAASVALTTTALLPSRGWLLVIACSFAGYCWSMEAGRRLSPRLNDALMRFYGPIAHPQERHRVNSATWFATALVLLALLWSQPAIMAGLAVLGVADPVAAIVGRRWGRRRLRSGRSLEGSLAFFVSGTLAAATALAVVGAGSPGVVLVAAGACAAVAAVVELYSTWLDDNLTIPLVGAAVAAGVMWVMG